MKTRAEKVQALADPVVALSRAMTYPTITMTIPDYEDLASNYGGICLACGETQDSGVEPDAENYRCESCDLRMVYGAEQCMLMGKIELVEP